MVDQPQGGQRQQRDPEALLFWASSNTGSSLPRTPFLETPGRPLPWPQGSVLTDTQQSVKVYTLKEDQRWDNQGTRHVIQQGMSLLVGA